MPTRLHHTHVFVNCPFDDTYRPVFNAIVFAVYAPGFVPRCALELDDSSEIRLDKILRIIEQCRYGIHDLSSVALDAHTGLPRFNMPLELGLYLGCKRFGPSLQHKKACLILDSEAYRYRAFMSDIFGTGHSRPQWQAGTGDRGGAQLARGGVKAEIAARRRTGRRPVRAVPERTAWNVHETAATARDSDIR